MARRHGAETEARSTGGEPGKRYAMDCREQGKDCTLLLSGSYEEVIQTGEMHARKAHGMTGSEEEVRRQLKDAVKPEREEHTTPA